METKAEERRARLVISVWKNLGFVKVCRCYNGFLIPANKNDYIPNTHVADIDDKKVLDWMETSVRAGWLYQNYIDTWLNITNEI